MCVGKRHLLTTARAAGCSAAPMCVGKARHVEPAERQRQGFLHVYGEGTNGKHALIVYDDGFSMYMGKALRFCGRSRVGGSFLHVYMGKAPIPRC